MTHSSPSHLDPTTALRIVKVVHTAVWAFFAGCILAIPAVAWRGSKGQALVLVAIVCGEIAVLVVNRWRCPLTDVAGRYTTDRSDNFDIYLPVWLARYNKVIFGWLFVVGLLVALGRWLGWLG